jgi:thiamine pyrophosphate-dependent acetolactate synthase large subunit-like protein
VKRYACLELLASWVGEHMLTVTSLSTNANMWSGLQKPGDHFYNLNMGLCLPFAVGLSLAFPQRKVVALDSDGSLMVDASSLITLAEVNPHNLVALVFDNQSYTRMGATATSRVTDLEKMAQGAGIRITRTIRTIDEFSSSVKSALDRSELSFFVVKVKPEVERVKSSYRRSFGRAMKESFVDALVHYPDYRGTGTTGPLPGDTQLLP